MKCFVNGNELKFKNSDFISSGKEGEVYCAGNKVYKIYIKPSDMIPYGKINELKELVRHNILIPIDIIYDKSNAPIGFSMLKIDNAINLCRLFVTKFLTKNSIDRDKLSILVRNMKDTIDYIHSKKCLIVDCNEFNFLIGSDFITPYFIDTNSYMTKSFPPTAIMETIKDYHSNSFTELTDWYSFAVVSCQIFLGVHPYKGKHSKFNDGDIKSRCLNNISIFNRDVFTPNCIRELSYIPNNYYDWFIELFEKGERIKPPDFPSNFKEFISTVVKQVSGDLISKIIGTYENDILFYVHNSFISCLKIDGKAIINGNTYLCSRSKEIIYTTRQKIAFVFVGIDNGKLNIESPNLVCNVDINCTDMIVSNDTVYIKTDKIIALNFTLFDKTLLPSFKTWNINSNSVTFYSGAMIQNVLGKIFLILINGNQLFQIRTQELDNKKIIDAKYLKNVCILTIYDGNRYDRYIYKFNQNHSEYSHSVFQNIEYLSVNFTVLDNGIVALFQSDDEFLMFTNKYDDNRVNTIKNNLPSGVVLCTNGDKCLYYFKNKLFEVSNN
ncbi:MAG: hypothetical protein A3K77_00100 [Euryarchaeota archaeon RBG_13_31_8]|nr:MAG: hypothetical protein A3K77_00100 [Euryarchaeota archaeon RBG_13_31_8]